MYKILSALSALIVAVLLSGCVTIYDGTMQKIMVKTNPPGANVLVEESRTKNIVATNTSPMEIKLKRKLSYHVKISKEGFQPFTVGVFRQPNNAIWIDLGLLPFHPPGTGLALVSALCDHISGAIWDLEPSDIQVTLQPVEQKKEETLAP